jgi:hypothetical protein
MKMFLQEIETWCGFIDKLPSDEDKAILIKLEAAYLMVVANDYDIFVKHFPCLL